MLVSKYSKPEFNPYGDEATVETVPEWEAPPSSRPLNATVSLPGSKSLTARELVLSAVADGPSTLHAALKSQDTTRMLGALKALGVSIEERQTPDGTTSFVVTPPEELLGSTTIDCGQAGTVMRFVPPLAALSLGPTVFDADKNARHRPIAPLVNALRQLGADINDDGRGALPFTVHGFGQLEGGSAELDASASSQFVSALLLAAPRFNNGLRLRHTGERLPSGPHIDMTIAALRARGVQVETPEVGSWQVAAGPIAGTATTIEPDLSNAAPFLAAALVSGGSVSIPNWPSETTQVGARLPELLSHFGATSELDSGTLTVTGNGTLQAVDLDLSEGGELATIIVALAALADGQSRITGIGHIRHHETDRLQALHDELTAAGAEVEILEDGLVVTPHELTPTTWHAHHDHRIATAGAVIGLRVAGMTVDDIGATAKTMPGFPELWHGMLAGNEVAG